MVMRAWFAMALWCVAALVYGVAAFGQGAGLKAAAGKVDITPDHSVFMAGYQWNRRSVDAHDRLMARCLVLESAGTRIAFVSLDVIGLFRMDIQKIRTLVKSVPPDHLF